MGIRLWKKGRKSSAIKTNPPETLSSEKQSRKTGLSEDLKPGDHAITSCLPQQQNCPEKVTQTSLCERCGACCAFFLVSFPSTETDVHTGGIVPIDLTALLSEDTSFMKGTAGKLTRCVALHGQVGFQVCCSIYKNRPSICRSFYRSWENDTGNSLCDKARAAYGMEPFTRF